MEDALLPCLFLKHNKGFPTVYDALQDLLKALVHQYEGPCAHHKKDPSDRFCSRCGQLFDETPSSEIPVGDLFTDLFLRGVNELSDLLEELSGQGWIVAYPTLESLQSTILIDEAERVLITLQGGEASMSWQYLPGCIRGLNPDFEFDKGIPKEKLE